MATDARFSTNLVSHPKTKKLLRRLGPTGGWAWVCLVLWTAANRSDGDLSGMSDEDIELSADWAGEEGALVRELVAIRFLDGEEGARQLHDWAEHNPWAAGADARSHKARWNAAKRHHGEAEADRLVPEYASIRAASSADSKPAAKGQQDDSNAPSPSPSPSPSHIRLDGSPEATPRPTEAGVVCLAMKQKGIPDVNPGNLELRALIDAGNDVGVFAAAAETAVNAGKASFAYTLGIVKRQAEQAQRIVADGLKAAPQAKSGAPPITVPSDAAERTRAELEARMAHVNDPEAKAAADAARRRFLEQRKASA